MTAASRRHVDDTPSSVARGSGAVPSLCPDRRGTRETIGIKRVRLTHGLLSQSLQRVDPARAGRIETSPRKEHRPLSRPQRDGFVLTTRLPGNRFLRFLLVGGLNTAFGYGIYALGLLLGAHYAVAATISTVLGVLFNFVTTGTLVFDRREGARLHRFVAVYVVTWAIGILMLKVASALGADLYIAGLVLLLPSAGLSFLLLRTFVFQERS
jgi:putative flippase GtrA